MSRNLTRETVEQFWWRRINWERVLRGVVIGYALFLATITVMVYAGAQAQYNAIYKQEIELLLNRSKMESHYLERNTRVNERQ